jgi:hypothetical protein
MYDWEGGMGVTCGGLKRAEFLDASLELTATRRTMSKRFEDIYKRANR